MYKKILLPLDLADDQPRVLETAAELARRAEGEILLLHVVQTIPGLSIDAERDFYGQLEATSQEFLTKLSNTLTDRGIRTRMRVLNGNRGEQVLDYATDNQIDLIIMRSPRIDPSTARSGVGSLSWKIGLFAPCDVLLVR
jgi:nucleotide-binding universal stress UspA family protein